MSSGSEEDSNPNHPPLHMADWVAALDRGHTLPSGQAEAADWSRRRLGILICVVALIFPVYSYLVQRAFLRAEASAAQEAMNQELRRLSEETMQTRQAPPAPAFTSPRPPPPVRVVGIIDGPQPTAIAKLHGRSPSEIAPSLCAQAEQWLQRDLSDQHIRIQEDRGDQPAQNAGVVWCE